MLEYFLMILKNKIIKVNNKMQSGYEYELTAREGKDFDPRFKPALTPSAAPANAMLSSIGHMIPGRCSLRVVCSKMERTAYKISCCKIRN